MANCWAISRQSQRFPVEESLDKIVVDEAVNELRTIQDMLRWSVSRFSEAEVYYGHGANNPGTRPFSWYCQRFFCHRILLRKFISLDSPPASACE